MGAPLSGAAMSEDQEKAKRMTMMDERLLGLSIDLSGRSSAERWEAAVSELPRHGARVNATLLQITAPNAARPA